MTWVKSADDFINPPDYGIAEAAARRMPSARYILIPASAETRGHGTHTWARFWQQELIDLLRADGIAPIVPSHHRAGSRELTWLSAITQRPSTLRISRVLIPSCGARRPSRR